MLINIQFPFVDLRYFSNGNTGKLKTPDLPIYNFISKNQFVRNFGSVENRTNTGIGYDENAYVNARRAVRITPEAIRDFNDDEVYFQDFIFRRLFTDGRANYRLELGAILELDYWGDFEKYSVEKLINKVLGIKTKVAKNPREETLARSVSSLLPLYLEASTSKKMPLPSNHILVGANPMIYMEVSKDEYELPPKARLISEKKFGNFDLYYEEIQYDRIPFSVWIIAYERYGHISRYYKKKFHARNLRLALLRQNYERECLKKVLLCTCMGKIAPNDKFQEYINRCDYINQVINPQSQQIKYDLTYKNLVLEIHRCQKTIDPNLEQILLDTTEGVRRSIKQKLHDFIKIEIEGGQFFMGNKNVYGDEVHGTKNDSGGGDINTASGQGVILSRTSGYAVGVGNITIGSNEELFAKLREKADEIDDNEEIKKSIDEMEENVGKESFADKFKNFLSSASEYLALFAPLVPFLKKLIVK